MSARKTPINLLPKSEFELSYWGRFLKWALSTGRYIIILTEIVVIAAFLSRFKLDQDLSDLTDAVNNKQQILKHTAATEKNFRLVQSRLDAAAALLSSQNKPSQILDAVASALPESLRLTSVAIATGQITVAAQAGSELDVGFFLGHLINQTYSDGSRKWKSITLNDISATDPVGIKFSFTAHY